MSVECLHWSAARQSQHWLSGTVSTCILRVLDKTNVKQAIRDQGENLKLRGANLVLRLSCVELIIVHLRGTKPLSRGAN